MDMNNAMLPLMPPQFFVPPMPVAAPPMPVPFFLQPPVFFPGVSVVPTQNVLPNPSFMEQTMFPADQEQETTLHPLQCSGGSQPSQRRLDFPQENQGVEESDHEQRYNE